MIHAIYFVILYRFSGGVCPFGVDIGCEGCGFVSIMDTSTYLGHKLSGVGCCGVDFGWEGCGFMFVMYTSSSQDHKPFGVGCKSLEDHMALYPGVTLKTYNKYLLIKLFMVIR